MRKLLVFAVVIILILIVGGAASRAVLRHANTNHDGPIFTSNYSLDTTKSDDLFVIADSAQLLSGSHVEANVSLIGRANVMVDGQVDGNLTVMGGDITLGQNAKISGNVMLIGNKIAVSGQVLGKLQVVAENLTIDGNARLTDNTTLCAQYMTIANANQTLGTRQCGSDERESWHSLHDGSFATKVISSGGFSLAGFIFTGIFALGLAALSGLIVTIFPRRFGLMTQAVHALPARVSRIGCLTQVSVVALLALLGLVIAVLPPLGLILLPILVLLMLPLGLMFAIGWVTMALLTGDWILRRFARRTSPPMLTVIAGSLGLFFIWTLLGVLPYGPLLGFLMILLVGALGLGAVMMTRVGTRSATRSYFVQG